MGPAFLPLLEAPLDPTFAIVLGEAGFFLNFRYIMEICPL
jgi:hypothetical protein